MRRAAAAVLVATALAVSACGSPAADTTTSAVSSDQAVVFAAASLSTVFPEIAEASYSFDGSSGLLDQLSGGAPADVFASADRANMDKAVEAGLVDGAPVQFATNHLVLVTPVDNPAGITGLDSTLDDAKLVICAPEVPCGAASLRLAEALGVELTPVSEEAKVTDVLGKVTSGEADAGLVYATDAITAGDAVETIEVPGAEEDPNTYWIARVTEAPHPEAADAFIATVTGESGQAVLGGAGFGPAQ